MKGEQQSVTLCVHEVGNLQTSLMYNACIHSSPVYSTIRSKHFVPTLAFSCGVSALYGPWFSWKICKHQMYSMLHITVAASHCARNYRTNEAQKSKLHVMACQYQSTCRIYQHRSHGSTHIRTTLHKINNEFAFKLILIEISSCEQRG